MTHPTAEARPASPSSSVSRTAALVALGLSLTVAVQCIRVLFPVMYTYREESGVTRTGLVLAAVFASPVLVIVLVKWMRPATGFLVAACALAAMRVVLQASGTVTVPLAAIAGAAALVAVTTGIVVLRHHGPDIVVALVGGLAFDTVLRGAWSTWDVVWQTGVGPWLVTAVLVVGLVVAAVLGRHDAARATGGAALPGLLLGPYLVLQFLFLQSPAFVSSSGGVALATAVACVLVGDALALAAIAFMSGPRVPSAAVIVAAGILAVAAWLLPVVTGAEVLGLLLLAQVLGTGLLARACGGAVVAVRGGAWRDVTGLTAGAVLLGAFVFLYQLHYDQALPFTNRWLPAVAGGLLGLAALVAPAAAAVGAGHLRRVGRLAVAVIVVTAVVFAGIALGEPDLAPAAAAPKALRVVTFNPHETVTRDGQLDPGAMADAVEQLRPDVLVVEEAGRGWVISSMFDLGEWAKRRLGLPYVWVPAADNQFGHSCAQPGADPRRAGRGVAPPERQDAAQRGHRPCRAGCR